MAEQMRLSEAIRAGAKLRPMATGEYFGVDGNAEVTTSCALGAAYEAIQQWAVQSTGAAGISRTLEGAYSCLRGDFCDGPPFTAFQWGLFDIITDMNDSERFTREEIADWLESIGE